MQKKVNLKPRKETRGRTKRNTSAHTNLGLEFFEASEEDPEAVTVLCAIAKTISVDMRGRKQAQIKRERERGRGRGREKLIHTEVCPRLDA